MVVRVHQSAKRLRRGGQAGQLVPGKFLAGLRPFAAAFLHQPQGHDVLHETEGGLGAAFIGEVVGQRLLRDEWLVNLHPQNGPGAGADEDVVTAVCRHRSHGGTGVMPGGGDHRHAFRPCLLGYRRMQRAEPRARRHDLAEDTRGQPQLLQHRPGPVAGAGIVALAGGGDGELADLAPRQPEVEQIGHVEESPGCVQQRRPLHSHGQQLVEAVQLQELDARALEDLLPRHTSEGFLHHAVGAAIAVVIGIAQQLVAGVEQPEVHAPGVQAQAGRASPTAFDALGQAAFHFLEQPQDVPMQVAEQAHRAVGEAVHLLQPQPLAVEAAHHGASATCT